jgi:uncharacterized membrane protein
MLLAWALAGASILWIATLTAAAARPFAPDAFIYDLVVAFSSLICHQQPERSFHWNSVAWPVCARCLGLYVAAPVGAVIAVAVRTPAGRSRGMNLLLLCIAAIPTLLTWLGEHLFGVPVSNAWRFAAALPLGGAVAWVLGYTLQDARRGQAR